LYGPDNYRSKEKLNEIIAGYKQVHKSGLNLVSFDAKEKDFKELQDNFKIASMFAEKKLVILRNLFLNKNFQEDFLKELENLENAKDIIIIFEAEKIDERLKIFKKLKKQIKCQEFNFLSANQLKNWAKKGFEKQDGKISETALFLLLNYAENDLWQIKNEIQKLCNYKQNKMIEEEDVKLLVRPKIENDIFKTIECVALKNKKQALELISKHIEKGDHPLQLLSMIIYQFKVLLIIKDLIIKKLSYGQIVKKSGLHPFVVQKNYHLCSQFSFEDLKKIYNKIFQIDADIKTGKIDSELALELLIAGI
jgi:DNA polymerase-3 subunit delta